jgi:protocatechuate 4,5-dioxygenase, alpha chain
MAHFGLVRSVSNRFLPHAPSVANIAHGAYVRLRHRAAYQCAAHPPDAETVADEGETPMARAKSEENEYEDIPGTFVFNADRSRQGYGINMFCMSLMKGANRKAFKANEAEYLKQYPLTPEQTDAILKRDYNRMLELGGNIYFTAKLGATDGHSFRHLAATMTGSTQEDYAAMMLAGGRSIEGNRSKSGKDKSAKAKSSKKKSTKKPAAKKRK